MNLLESSPLVSIENVSMRFPIRKGFFNQTVGYIHAVNDVSLNIQAGETLGIVGESGCGKSTLARCILQLLRPSAGRILFEGQDLTQLSDKALRPLRQHFQIIFQNPYTSLDPRMTIGDTLAEPFWIHRPKIRGEALQAELKTLLDMVGLSQAMLGRYPHELSGGQRQRVGIARALALRPKLIVADEAVSALDVSVQAQILNLLKDLKTELNLTYLFIAHNLSVVEYISDRVGVMYLGKLVELGTTRQVYDHPAHPYTQALLSAITVPDPTYDTRQRILLHGDLPSPANPPSGCPFHTRCRYVQPDCQSDIPTMQPFSAGQQTACLHAEAIRVGAVSSA